MSAAKPPEVARDAEPGEHPLNAADCSTNTN